VEGKPVMLDGMIAEMSMSNFLIGGVSISSAVARWPPGGER